MIGGLPVLFGHVVSSGNKNWCPATQEFSYEAASTARSSVAITPVISGFFWDSSRFFRLSEDYLDYL